MNMNVEGMNAWLKRFGVAMKKRNDPIVKQSYKVMRLSLGETVLRRFWRTFAFAWLEIEEVLSGDRRRMDREQDRD